MADLFGRRPMFYDRSGVPLSIADVEPLLVDETYKRIARTTVLDGADPQRHYEVSTVWLGTDYNFAGEGPPIIFETMVFAPNDEGDELHDAQCRYATETQARTGHTQVVTEVAAECTDPIVMDATKSNR